LAAGVQHGGLQERGGRTAAPALAGARGLPDRILQGEQRCGLLVV